MVKFILDIINSKRDTYGNCYWAFRFTDCRTGKQVKATITGGESNISASIREMGLDWKVVYYTRHELPIREYNALVADWPYAGCPPADIAAFIQRELKKRKKKES